MPAKVRICVFGAGRMGERHIANVAANDRAELAYVIDPDLVRARMLDKKYGCRAADNPALALSDPDVDAVIIASATKTHVDLIAASAKAGKVILCEKPIDLEMSRIDRCAKEIEGRDVGKVEVITIVSRDPSPPHTLRFLAVSFTDQMIHDFDLALWLSGASGRVEMFSMASNLVDAAIGELGDSDTAQVTLRFESGAFCRIDCSRRAVYGYDQRVEVFGSKGMVCSTNPGRTAIERYSALTSAARDVLNPGFMERYWPTYAVELNAFLDVVRGAARVTPDFESDRRALQLANAARESSKTGRLVVVDIGAGEPAGIT